MKSELIHSLTGDFESFAQNGQNFKRFFRRGNAQRHLLEPAVECWSGM